MHVPLGVAPWGLTRCTVDSHHMVGITGRMGMLGRQFAVGFDLMGAMSIGCATVGAAVVRKFNCAWVCARSLVP